jgi:hypothetical protein
MRTVFYVATAAALALAFRFGVAPSAAAKDGGGKLRVSVDDLGKTAELVGRLGKPLGTWVMIKGKWALPVSREKPSGLKFTVTHVSDTKLEKPVEFDVALVNVVDRRGNDATPNWEDRNKFDGQTWTLKGYETGEFHITPPEYYREIGSAPGLMAKPDYLRAFTSRIDGVLNAK